MTSMGLNLKRSFINKNALMNNGIGRYVPQLARITLKVGIVLFKSLRNIKKRKKGNFTSKSNSNTIKLFGVGGNIVLNKISTF